MSASLQNGVSRRVWLNVTQEGKAAVDDLREAGLVNGLKLSTEDFQPVTAYQVSHKGQNFIKQLSDVRGWLQSWRVRASMTHFGVSWRHGVFAGAERGG